MWLCPSASAQLRMLPQDLLDKAHELAATIAANGPLAVPMIKKVAETSSNVPLAQAIESAGTGVGRDARFRKIASRAARLSPRSASRATRAASSLGRVSCARAQGFSRATTPAIRGTAEFRRRRGSSDRRGST